jgi:carbon storage regulator
MLVLTRKENEEVCIGHDVVVTVLRAKNGEVRLGFTAPTSVKIDRMEVALRIEKERRHGDG